MTAQLSTQNESTSSFGVAGALKAEALKLDRGGVLEGHVIAYQTYGTLNNDRSNAILLCHALTGDQYATDKHPVTQREGWWHQMVGPGLSFDTDRFFIICPNVLGGCMGTTGPKEMNPATGLPWNMDFPVITIGDMVRSQKMLIDHLGIEQLFCIAGGSMGAMQVLEWCAQHGDRVFSAIPVAGATRHTAQNIALHEVGRQAIRTDPDWRGGDYSTQGVEPRGGLATARMLAHITYLSEASLDRKFSRALQDRDSLSYSFDVDFKVESYLRHQGEGFVERFDANSYLYITKAMDYFDLEEECGGDLPHAFAGKSTRFCVVSFSSDWLFPTSESRRIVHALNAAAANVSFVEINSDKGHDAFLLDEPEFRDVVAGFLGGCAKHRGLAP